MKRLVLSLVLLIAFSGISEARSGGGPVRVRGSVTKSGTYRQPHYRTSPNRTQRDNWSSKGNTNPYTGKEGTKIPRK